MLVSAIHQHESATDIHTFPSLMNLPPTLSHPSRLSQTFRFQLSASYSKFSLAIYFTYDNIYVSILLFPFVPPSSSPTVSTRLFFMSVSPLLPCKKVHQFHLSRFHIWYLFFSFWLTSLCIIGSRFIYLIRTDSNVFLFIVECYSVVYMYHNFFIHSFVNDHLSCVHILDIVNSAVMNVGVHVFFSVTVSARYNCVLKL